MNSIVIGKDSLAYAAKYSGGTISGINEINLLADGAIAVFTNKSEMVTAANVATILIDRIGCFIAVGSGDPVTGSYVTTTIGRINARYNKIAYVAPVKTVKYLGYDGTTAGTALNLPTLIAGAEAFIRITDTTEGKRTMGTVYTNEVKSYSYMIKTGDIDTDITTAIVTAINNDPTSAVVAAQTGATGVTLGISLTAKNFGQTFALSVDGVFISSTRVEAEALTTVLKGVAVAPTYGEGTYAQVLALEDLFSPARGNTNKISQAPLWWTVPSMAVVGKTYTQYNLLWTGKNDRATGSSTTTNMQVMVALVVGSSQLTTFETIMAQVFGVEEEAESGVL